jgi:hypothetical protein
MFVRGTYIENVGIWVEGRQDQTGGFACSATAGDPRIGSSEGLGKSYGSQASSIAIPTSWHE